MTEIYIITLIFLFISLGLNIYLFFLLKKKKQIPFEETFSVLNSVIDYYRKKLNEGLLFLSKKYSILTNSGGQQPPNDSIKEYSLSKKQLKSAVIKKIIRNVSLDVRNQLLVYYTESGLIDYIINELDKEDQILTQENE